MLRVAHQQFFRIYFDGWDAPDIQEKTQLPEISTMHAYSSIVLMLLFEIFVSVNCPNYIFVSKLDSNKSPLTPDVTK